MRGSSDPDTEQGHQMISPLRYWFSSAFGLGLTSTCTAILASGSGSSGGIINNEEGVGGGGLSMISTIGLATVIALNAGIDSYGNDCAAIEHYNHEFLRERWEHETAPEHEIEEYINYATNIGVPPKDAREIASMLVQHQQLSIPHHLVFELGLLRPCFYHRPYLFGITRFIGLLTGFIASIGITSILSYNNTIQMGIIMWICGSITIPLRYQHLWNLAYIKRLIITQSSYYAAILIIAGQIGKANSRATA